MKIKDFMAKLYRETVPELPVEKTCDTFKIGDPEQEISKIAVAMFPTADVIRKASEWGANLLIVHEPTFYNHRDDPAELAQSIPQRLELIKAKREFIKKHGITIYRFHDHPHCCVPDMISEGETKYWGLEGVWKKGDFWAVNDFELTRPLPVLEVARILEKNLGIKHIRICGSRETIVRMIGLCFGTPGHLDEQLLKNDIVLTGEICEWNSGEFARDLTEIAGLKRSLLVLGHIPSEQQGMRLLADRIPQQYAGFQARFFECQEVYSYTDSE